MASDLEEEMRKHFIQYETSEQRLYLISQLTSKGFEIYKELKTLRTLIVSCPRGAYANSAKARKAIEEITGTQADAAKERHALSQ